MIRMRSGIMFRSKETMTLPPIMTNNTDKLMMTACCNCTVMASAEQMPNTCTVMGLESSNGSTRSFRFFFENNDSFLAVAAAVSVLIAALGFGIQNSGGTPSGCD